MPFSLAPDRAAAARSLAESLAPGQRVCLTTHVNPDGDGLGSEAGLAHLLRDRGIDAVITNPTPTPSRFAFLFEDLPGVDRTTEAVRELRRADRIIVLDISDLGRLGMLGETVRSRGVPVACIDHHVSEGVLPDGPRYLDAGAAATGELVFELAVANGWRLTEEAARGLYVAILTDTGGFRFSNTTPRCHMVAAQLLAAGIDPEEMYRRIYASVPLGRLQLLRDALATLEVDDEHGVAWISVPADALERYDLRSEDLDGIVEHPRSLSGTRLALFFRDLGYGKVKVSFRSTGDVDVNRFAKQFGGGGHARASGALIPGTIDEVRERVVAAAREYVAALDD
jgi:bifunctional oligoribonuclease and PAP phosphatase NrnA